jgi:hypothetical protein
MQKETAYKSGEIDINGLSAGIYVLGIHSDNNRYRHIQKLIRE